MEFFSSFFPHSLPNIYEMKHLKIEWSFKKAEFKETMLPTVLTRAKKCLKAQTARERKCWKKREKEREWEWNFLVSFEWQHFYCWNTKVSHVFFSSFSWVYGLLESSLLCYVTHNLSKWYKNDSSYTLYMPPSSPLKIFLYVL